MHIMIIDDEKILSSSLQRKLEKNEYRVTTLHSYKSFLKEKAINIDLYIIDVSLGDGSGFNIIKILRASDTSMNAPILLMSGHDDIATKVEGLDIGADDYIVKPFNPEEILARIRTLMRRSKNSFRSEDTMYRNIRINPLSREITQNGRKILLTKKEKQIFDFFIRNQERLITKDEMIEKIWGKKICDTTYNTINVTICNLRKKLGSIFKLKTQTGEGYILEK